LKTPQNWIIAILAIVVGFLFFQQNDLRLQWPVAKGELTSTATVAPAESAPTSTTNDKWSGDLLGPEQPFPATANGPALAEIYDQSSGFCALIKVNTGESLPWNGPGAFWQALPEGLQDAIDDRWPHQLQEYLAKPKTANCYYFLSVAEFLQAFPTFR
jgi:hypothetical protein